MSRRVSNNRWRRTPTAPPWCKNCGGEHANECSYPITSYGIICFKRDPSTLKISYILVSRKHSINYGEFLRGNYSHDDCQYLMKMFSRMTIHERNSLLDSRRSFDSLFRSFWADRRPLQHKTFNQIRKLFTITRNGYNIGQPFEPLGGNRVSIPILINATVPAKSTEWTFPKGRLSYTRRENGWQCACREFREETAIPSSKLRKMGIQYIEDYYGSNGSSYRTILYLAEWTGHPDMIPTVDPNNRIQIQEIGSIGWFTSDQALELILPYHEERRRVIRKVETFLSNYYG